ncbi:hypothetical protein FACS18949_09390 [Clostridia bacterium]|nr:hypothetical protein FACS18949_09390 [Clostridia bacterium]
MAIHTFQYEWAAGTNASAMLDALPNQFKTWLEARGFTWATVALNTVTMSGCSSACEVRVTGRGTFAVQFGRYSDTAGRISLKAGFDPSGAQNNYDGTVYALLPTYQLSITLSVTNDSAAVKFAPGGDSPAAVIALCRLNKKYGGVTAPDWALYGGTNLYGVTSGFLKPMQVSPYDGSLYVGIPGLITHTNATGAPVAQTNAFMVMPGNMTGNVVYNANGRKWLANPSDLKTLLLWE